MIDNCILCPEFILTYFVLDNIQQDAVVNLRPFSS